MEVTREMLQAAKVGDEVVRSVESNCCKEE